MQLIKVGKIGKPHGFSGAFVTQGDAGQESALSAVAVVLVGSSPADAKPYAVEEAAWMPRGWKLKLAGITSDAQVRELSGLEIYVNRAELPEPEADEYYAGDLELLTVKETETGKTLGRFLGVESTGTGGADRWWFGDEHRSFAVPATKRFIDRVDREAGVLWLKNLGELE